MNVVIIHGRDHDDGEKFVIGVADSVERAEEMIEEYFGKGNYEILERQDIRDGMLEYSQEIEATYEDSMPSTHTVLLEWSILNEI